MDRQKIAVGLFYVLCLRVESISSLSTYGSVVEVVVGPHPNTSPIANCDTYSYFEVDWFFESLR